MFRHPKCLYFVTAITMLLASCSPSNSAPTSTDKMATVPPQLTPQAEPEKVIALKPDQTKAPATDAIQNASTPAAHPDGPQLGEASMAQKNAARELLLNNRNFEASPESPNFFPWKVVRWTEDAGNAIRVPAPEGGEGNLSLEFTGGNVELEYVVDASNLNVGDGIVKASIAGIAHAPDQLVLQLKYKSGEEAVWLNEARHAGDGKWQVLECAAPLPKDANPDALILRVFRNSKGKDGKLFPDSDRVFVDSASLSIQPLGAAQQSAPAPRPAAAEPAPRPKSAIELLVNNRGFEDNPDESGILPWKIVRFTESAGHVERVAATNGAKGSFAAEFTGGDVELRRTIDKLDETVRGATISAKIDGLAQAKDQLILQVKYVIDGEEKWLCQAEHPGDGKWHTIAAVGNLPSDIAAEAIVYRVFRSGKDAKGKQIAAKGNVQVDDAQLVIERS